MLAESQLVDDIKCGKHAAFTLLFDKYYRDLVLFAGNFIGERNVCEDIVQSLFMRLWADKASLCIESSLRSFLLRSVRNACLDEIKHRQVVREHVAYAEAMSSPEQFDVDNYILYSDLKEKLDIELSALSPELRESFTKNRFEGLKYREIALQLNVSERTVEVRIGKALSLLRERLKNYLITVILLMLI